MNIKDKRVERGLLQKDIMADVSLYSKIENGKALSTPKDSERLAKIFGCEIQELFSENELSFFDGVLRGFNSTEDEGGKLLAAEEKAAARAICKPEKRHLGFVRKCYWLNKTRNKDFSKAIVKLGYKTAQAWFSAVVDEAIEQAESFDPETRFYYSDYMGKEECL